jgi:hypothetical protein
MRTVSIAGAALVMLALAGALSACGGYPASDAARNHLASSGSPPSGPVASGPVASSPTVSPPVSSSHGPSSPGRSSPPPVSSPPVAAPPHITVVRLGTTFSPDTLRLSVGGQFLVAVSPSVHASVLGVPPGCASQTAWPTDGGLLSVRCVSGGYLYAAERPGSATISATVGPRCGSGQMCPQWLSAPRLQVSIT